LAAAIRIAVDHRLHGEQESGEVPEFLLTELLKSVSVADGGCAMATSRLPRSWDGVKASPEQVGRLAEVFATRALELQDRGSLVMLRTSLGALGSDPRGRAAMMDSGSIVAAMCSWAYPLDSLRFAEWYCELLKTETDDLRRYVRYVLRIGGAALASGRLHVAVRVASYLTAWDVDLDDPNISMANETNRVREALLSNMGGRYLGDSPADTLNNFMRFAREIPHLT
jgi:hypothetical protein